MCREWGAMILSKDNDERETEGFRARALGQAIRREGEEGGSTEAIRGSRRLVVARDEKTDNRWVCLWRFGDGSWTKLESMD